MVLLAVSVGLSALSLLLQFLIEDWGSPSSTGPSSVVESLMGTIGSGVSLALIIVFCMWLFRILKNAKQRHPEQSINAGWTVGSFFVPFVHLLLPYFELRQGWRADVSPDTRDLTRWFVPWSLHMASWYVFAPILVLVALDPALDAVRAAGPGEPPDLSGVFADLRPLLLGMSSVSLVLQTLAAFFLARVVRRWTALQEGPPVS